MMIYSNTVLPIALDMLFLIYVICSIQLNITSMIIPRYLAEFTQVIEALSVAKSSIISLEKIL